GLCRGGGGGFDRGAGVVLHAGGARPGGADPAIGLRADARGRPLSNLELGIWSFPALLLLLFLRIPIGLAMLLCGLVGTWLIMGSWTPILSRLKGETYSTFSSYSLSIIPLFLLMGQFASLGGMSQSLFKAAAAWLGHR